MCQVRANKWLSKASFVSLSFFAAVGLVLMGVNTFAVATTPLITGLRVAEWCLLPLSFWQQLQVYFLVVLY